MVALNVDNPETTVGGNVTVDFQIPLQLKKYFNKDTLLLEYEPDVSSIPESILSIPALTLVAPVAWATDTDIHAGKVDESFIQGLYDVQKGLQQLYPNVFNTDSEFNCTPVENQPRLSNQSGILFSGGVDSTTSFYRRRSEKPDLINITQDRDSESKVQDQSEYISSFADNMGVNSTEIFSNGWSVLHMENLNIDFQHHLERDWWNAVMYGIYYMAICAPYAWECNIDTLYQASSYTSNRNLPEAQPFIVESVQWAGTTTKISEIEMKRHEKIELIGDFVSKHDGVEISSCYTRSIRENCMDCEKCFRTSLGAASVGVSPETIGFEIKAETINNIKLYIRDQDFSGFHAHMWKEIQDTVDPDTFAISDDELIKLLQNADINTNEAMKISDLDTKKKIYLASPYPLDVFLLTVYKLVRDVSS